MKILVISDLHIGTGGDGDTFRWKPADFIDKLADIFSEYEVDDVILNGDIYELYKYSFEAIREANPELVEFLEHFYYIRGNHDNTAPYGEDEWNYTNKDGIRIHIEHGHLCDWLNGTKIGRAAGTLLYKVLKRIVAADFVRNIYMGIMEHEEQFHRVPRKYDRYKYLNYALKLLKKEYDVVVLGHTHHLEYVKTWMLNTKKRYFNSGSCSFGRFQGIVLDTETLFYRTIP
jgi:predicted phosphodiesterase